MRKSGGPPNLYSCALSKPEVLKPLMSSTLKYRIFFFKKNFYLFIWLVLAVWGLHCCVGFFSSCEPGLLSAVVHGLLTAGASLVEECGL